MAQVLCLIGFDDDPVIKDFIRIHVDKLPGEKLLLAGSFPDHRLAGVNIRREFEQPRWMRHIVSLMPARWATRRQQHMKNCSRSVGAAYGRFFRKNGVDTILAEFGDTGADIASVAVQCGIPLIVHFHGHDAHRRSLLSQELLAKYALMFGSASAVMVVSRYMYEALIQMGCPKDKLIYNPYGPREKFFSVCPNYYGVVLSVGRFTDIKANYLVLMAFQRALQHVPYARLVMAGGGELLETCRTLARVWHIEHAVEFTGPVEHSRVHELFANACCFAQHSVSPSYGDAEGTPNTILEACAAGLPVVATRHAGIPDVVVHGETGLLVEERDVDGMADHMVELLGSPARCRELGDHARQRIRRHFTAESHIARLDEAIRCARNRDAAGIARLAKESLKVGIDE
ncbi:MAG: hypothetical protein RLZZ536_1904 [Planctomycetota bacterium]